METLVKTSVRKASPTLSYKERALAEIKFALEMNRIGIQLF